MALQGIWLAAPRNLVELEMWQCEIYASESNDESREVFIPHVKNPETSCCLSVMGSGGTGTDGEKMSLLSVPEEATQ